MTSYRLIGDHGASVGEFDADDDKAAERAARELSESVATARSTGYRLEREDGNGWFAVLTWMPARVSHSPIPVNNLVTPPKPERPTPGWVRPPS